MNKREVPVFRCSFLGVFCLYFYYFQKKHVRVWQGEISCARSFSQRRYCNVAKVHRVGKVSGAAKKLDSNQLAKEQSW